MARVEANRIFQCLDLKLFTQNFAVIRINLALIKQLEDEIATDKRTKESKATSLVSKGQRISSRLHQL